MEIFKPTLVLTPQSAAMFINRDVDLFEGAEIVHVCPHTNCYYEQSLDESGNPTYLGLVDGEERSSNIDTDIRDWIIEVMSPLLLISAANSNEPEVKQTDARGELIALGGQIESLAKAEMDGHSTYHKLECLWLELAEETFGLEWVEDTEAYTLGATQVEIWAYLIKRVEETPNIIAKKRYSHAYDFAFEIESAKEDASDLTASEIRKALIARANSINDAEMMEAVAEPSDTHEV